MGLGVKEAGPGACITVLSQQECLSVRPQSLPPHKRYEAKAGGDDGERKKKCFCCKSQETGHGDIVKCEGLGKPFIRGEGESYFFIQEHYS